MAWWFMERSPSSVRNWLRKAARDVRAAESLIDDEDMAEVVAFHAQQAVEKAMKGVAAFLGVQEIPRTHNLEELAHLVARAGGHLPASEDELEAFEPFAVSVRYDEEPVPDEAAIRAALALARRFLGWAKEMTGE